MPTAKKIGVLKISSMSAMTPDTGFIVQIYAEDAGLPKFRGTGILVAPSYVLTCAHTVLDIDPESFSGPCKENDRLVPRNLIIGFGGSSLTRGSPKGKVIAYDFPDLALVRLAHPRRQSKPVRFAFGINSSVDSALLQVRARVIGYSMSSPRSLLEYRVHGLRPLMRRPGKDELLTVQSASTFALGMSGSPLLAMFEGQWVCLAMAYMGREGGPVSNLILADTLHSFLARHKVRFARPLDTRGYFEDTLGRSITAYRHLEHLSPGQFAASLGISEETLHHWETGSNWPAGPYRDQLLQAMGRKEPGQAEKWRLFLEELDKSVPAARPLNRLRKIAQPAGIKIELCDHVRSIGPDESPRPRLVIGSKIRVVVNLPWPGHATFLNIVGLESSHQRFFCLDRLFNLTCRLPAEKSTLPLGNKSINIRAPRTASCLAVLARKDRPFTWSKTGFEDFNQIPENEVLQQIHSLAAFPPDQFMVSFYEYDVVEP